MKNDSEKMPTDLNNPIENQDVKSDGESTGLIDIDDNEEIQLQYDYASFDARSALNLVSKAYEMDSLSGRETAGNALQFDINCIEAYEYLGMNEEIAELGIPYYEKGIAIGREKFGGEYLKKNKGLFWKLDETRSFMRCMHLYAKALYDVANITKAIEILEEMIALNPEDDQGARDMLLLYLLEYDERIKFNKYERKFKKDHSAFALYIRALFSFMVEEDSESSNAKLLLAIRQNRFIPRMLLNGKRYTEIPDSYNIGSEEEALRFVTYTKMTWGIIDGSLDWLKEIYTPPKKFKIKNL